MANTKNTSVSNRHGKQSIDSIRSNYDQAMAGAKKLRDPNRGFGVSLTSYDREAIRGYLQSPANSETGLRRASRYLYIRNQIYNRICHWYASMWDLRCRTVVPNFTMLKDVDNDKMLKEYENTVTVLDSYHLQGNWHDVALRCYVEDVVYAIFFRDGENAFFYMLDPDECRIDGEYFTTDLSYSVDMSKWETAQRRELIEWLGEPLESMMKEHDRTKERWIHMTDEYAACFKFNHDRIDLVFPPFSPLLQSIAGLNDTADLQAIADQAAIYKLLLMPMKVRSGATETDEFEISPDILLEYFDKLREILPDYIAAAPVPGEITNDDVIDFSTTSADKDIDRLQQSQDTVLATSGGGAVLNANYITSTEAFKAWLKAETEFAISSLLPQIEGFTNRMLKTDVKGNPCKVKYFEVSVYTKEDLKDGLLEAGQHSFSTRLAYMTTLGFSEMDALSLQHFENDVLKLPESMIYPLNSSYTQSGDNNGEAGRPEKDSGDLTPDGDRSRNR